MSHWKFGRMRNAKRDVFPQVFEFSQTSKQTCFSNMFFKFLVENYVRRKEKQLVYFDYQYLNSIFCAIITATACASSLFPLSYRHTF